MKRYWLFLLATTLAIGLPLSAWADVELVKTADGTTFKFGMSNKFQMFNLQNLSLVENGTDRAGQATGNFRSFISADTQLGDTDWGILNFNNLRFTMERGPLRIHANLEIETNIDANAVDQNNPNMERFALYYKFEDLGTLAVGFDVHAFDPEGGLIYTDEHPGVWLVGGDDNLSWTVGWHHVLNCDRGPSLFSSAGSFCPTTLTGLPGASRGDAGGAGGIANSHPSNPVAGDTDSGQQSDLFLGRLNINVADGVTISPIFAYYRRHVPQSGLLNEFSDPTGTMIAGFGTGVDNSTSNQWRPSAVVKAEVGAATLTFQGAGLLGKINDVGAGFMGGAPPILDPGGNVTNHEDFDIRSFALFFEAALDGDEIGMSGMTPYLSVEFHSGDDDPFDDQYQGYVPISNLTAALRKDGFKGQSITSLGPASLGANSNDGWGFDVTARGQGPTLGTIVPDETLGVVNAQADAAGFNNRGGKAGNPGFVKGNIGILGKIAEGWDTHFGVSAMWWHKTEATEAEVAQNCTAFGTFGCTSGDPRDVSLVRSNLAAINTAPGLGDLDSTFMGFEINGNVGYTTDGGLRIQPYFSVFVPGDSVKSINTGFLGGGTSGQPTFDKETGFMGGVEISASF